jgi:dipeptidyl aminopeptidase/acylaminoacyl peptidase
MFQAAFDDCQRAVRWVRANAAAYGVKASRIGAIGASAGGHLVSLLGVRPTRDDSDPVLANYSSRVQAVVTVFGPADLTRDFSHLKFGGGSVQDLVDNFAGKGLGSRAREASPIFHVNSRTAPILIFHGERDEVVPVEQARDFHAALKAAGCESRYIEFAGEGHSFRQPETVARFHRETSSFFKRHLLSGPRPDGAAPEAPSTTARAQ